MVRRGCRQPDPRLFSMGPGRRRGLGDRLGEFENSKQGEMTPFSGPYAHKGPKQLTKKIAFTSPVTHSYLYAHGRN